MSYDHKSQTTVLPLSEILIVGVRTRTAYLYGYKNTVLHSTYHSQTEIDTVFGTRRNLPSLRFPASKIQEAVTRLSKLGALQQTCPAFSNHADAACDSRPYTTPALEKLLLI